MVKKQQIWIIDIDIAVVYTEIVVENWQKTGSYYSQSDYQHTYSLLRVNQAFCMYADNQL